MTYKAGSLHSAHCECQEATVLSIPAPMPHRAFIVLLLTSAHQSATISVPLEQTLLKQRPQESPGTMIQCAKTAVLRITGTLCRASLGITGASLIMLRFDITGQEQQLRRPLGITLTPSLIVHKSQVEKNITDAV